MVQELITYIVLALVAIAVLVRFAKTMIDIYKKDSKAGACSSCGKAKDCSSKSV